MVDWLITSWRRWQLPSRLLLLHRLRQQLQALKLLVLKLHLQPALLRLRQLKALQQLELVQVLVLVPAQVLLQQVLGEQQLLLFCRRQTKQQQRSGQTK